MTRKRIISIGGLLIVLTVVLAFMMRTLSPADYMLIYHTGMFRTEAEHFNGAALITDKDKISKVKRLFSLNTSMAHACGYHWNISFWTGSSGGQIIPFNQDCEEFYTNTQTIHNTVQPYFRQIETNPTHFIYNLKVPTSITPQKLTTDFEKAGLPIFFLTGKDKNLPFVTYQYMQISTTPDTDDRGIWKKAQAENEKIARGKMLEIIGKVKDKYEVERATNISFPMTSFGRTIVHRAEVTIKFKLDSELIGLQELLKSEGAEIKKLKVPTDYYVQLVDSEIDLGKVKTKITKDFDYIIDVFKYPWTQEQD